jgi:hypothetical protein
MFINGAVKKQSETSNEKDQSKSGKKILSNIYN